MEKTITLNYDCLTYLFNDTIDNVWNFLTNDEMMNSVTSYFRSSNQYLKGSNYEKGSEYMIVYNNKETLKLIVVDRIEEGSFKQLRMKCHHLNNSLLANDITYSLYAGTIDSKTSLVFEIRWDVERVMKESEYLKSKDDRLKLFKLVSEKLKELAKVDRQSESVIIDCSIDMFWKILLNWNILNKVMKQFPYVCNYEGPIEKPGQKFGCINLATNSINELTVIRLEKCESPLKTYFLTLHVKENEHCATQNMNFMIISTGENTCLFFFEHIFEKTVSTKVLENVGNNKKQLLGDLKGCISIIKSMDL